MRKVKFTQDSFDEKLGAILEEFPIIDVSVMSLSLISLCFGGGGMSGRAIVLPIHQILISVCIAASPVSLTFS